MKHHNIEGVKFDQDKVRTELLPSDALLEVAKVLTFGAKKYGDRNWEAGMKWSRLVGAALRHIFARCMGEKHDPETGLSHWVHAMCCLMFLTSYELRDVGEKDIG